MEKVRRNPIPPSLVPAARLPEEFRQNAAEARRLAGSEVAAHVWESAATAVEERLRDSILEPLTLDAAESESGYSRSHLRRWLRN
jgi:AraC-like DNA-binding protein